MADEGASKTEEPTPKKIEDARKRGQVWKSRDLTSALVFISGFAAMSASVSLIEGRFRALFLQSIQYLEHPGVAADDAEAALGAGMLAVILLSLPAAVTGAVVGGLSDFLQVGALFSPEAVAPKLDKLNPLQGLANLFSRKTALEALKSVVKVSLAGYLAWGVLRDHVGLVALAGRSDPIGIARVGGELVFRLTVRLGLLLLLAGIFDVWLQRRSYMKDMMMSRDEVKREHRESEGDPTHKHKRRELHQEILEHAAIEDVKNADVVITNPTHYAVALRYRKDADPAPRIMAKGMDERAARIKAVARAAGVPEVRNVPLAQALHRLEVGDDIPEDLYDAVAEVLNFVYQLSHPPDA